MEKTKQAIDLKYAASPTARQFHASDAFVRGIRGPVGSGKSVACIWEIMKRAMAQSPAPDGLRYSRWLVVRNTYGELKETTIKTWDSWFPEHIFGKRSRQPPFEQLVRFNDVHLEVIFMALNTDEDTKKLLSFEPTGIWINEAREVPYEIVSKALSRLGRYPSEKMGGCTWSGLIMDTNPPDDRHWWYDMAENDGWRRDPKTGDLKPLEEFPETQRWEFFSQPSGLSAEAENVENLMQTPETLKWDLDKRRKHGQENYYKRMCAGQTEEFVKVYVHGEYGMVVSGKAVFDGYWNDDIHVAQSEINRIEGAEVIVGLDCSGRNPAAVFLQRGPEGKIVVLDEMLCEDTGAEMFADFLKAFCYQYYKDYDLKFFGDPAGGWKSQNNEETYFDVLRSRGIKVHPANDGLRFAPRREAVISVLTRMVRGKPALLINKNCKWLRQGFNGGYFYKKQKTSSGETVADTPEKKGNRCADVMDAFMYALVGMGEVRKLRQKNRIGHDTVIADWGFNV